MNATVRRCGAVVAILAIGAYLVAAVAIAMRRDTGPLVGSSTFLITGSAVSFGSRNPIVNQGLSLIASGLTTATMLVTDPSCSVLLGGITAIGWLGAIAMRFSARGLPNDAARGPLAIVLPLVVETLVAACGYGSTQTLRRLLDTTSTIAPAVGSGVSATATSFAIVVLAVAVTVGLGLYTRSATSRLR